MPQETAPSAPPWIRGACIGLGVAFGSVATRNGLGIESSALQLLAGSIIGVVIALGALGLVHLWVNRAR